MNVRKIMSNIEQRTPAWHQIRAGKFTGSKFNDAMARSKIGRAHV